MVLNISDNNFQDTIKEGLVLVDFWAPWCGPCKILGPVLEEMDEIFNGKLTIAKMNVDENQITPQRFEIMSIPTMILFKDGQPVEKVMGFQPKEIMEMYLQEKINEHGK